MTSQSPRIYTYKITFVDVPYYYYGVHKEKKFDEYYMGSPKTHKWCWELYEPKKQILEIFEFSDEGWLEAQEIEKQLIKPVFNEDEWCLNESCGGKISLKVYREVGLNHKGNGTGVFNRTLEEMRENGRRSGLKCKENGTGVCGMSKEQRSELGRKNGLKCKENGTGVCGIPLEQRIETSRKVGLDHKENGTGVCGISKEQRQENGKKVCAQRWECIETGHISSPGGLSNYQRARGIDTSKRKRIG
jgi:hypothetical protein